MVRRRHERQKTELRYQSKDDNRTAHVKIFQNTLNMVWTTQKQTQRNAVFICLCHDTSLRGVYGCRIITIKSSDQMQRPVKMQSPKTNSLFLAGDIKKEIEKVEDEV